MYSVTFLTGMILLYSITLCLTIPIAKDQRSHLGWAQRQVYTVIDYEHGWICDWEIQKTTMFSYVQNVSTCKCIGMPQRCMDDW